MEQTLASLLALWLEQPCEYGTGSKIVETVSLSVRGHRDLGLSLIKIGIDTFTPFNENELRPLHNSQ